MGFFKTLLLKFIDTAGSSDGQVLTSTGDGATPAWETLVSGDTRVYQSQDFNDFETLVDTWTETLAGGGTSAAIAAEAFQLATSATGGGRCTLRRNLNEISESRSPRMVSEWAVTTQGTDYEVMMCIGFITVAAAGLTMTNHHAGFYIDRTSGTSTLYASSGDGTTQQTTDVSSGITLTDYNVYDVRVESGSVTFYINGTLVATHSTNVPTNLAGWDAFPLFAITNENVASDSRLRIAYATYGLDAS